MDLYVFFFEKVILNSLHKYKPRISIIDVISKKKIYETSFDETQFIAVTAYQNEEVSFCFISFFNNSVLL